MPAEALPAGFYARPVLAVARELIGCVVEYEGCAGVIVETEAYHESEPACHAYVGLTPRTSTLFGPPGRAYVYRSYGIHALLNAVCEPAGVGAAVRERDLCSGPGKLTQALAVELSHNGGDLCAGPVRIRGPAPAWREPDVVAGTRVGITKAVELPWRFCVAGNRHVSRPWPRASPRLSAAPLG